MEEYNNISRAKQFLAFDALSGLYNEINKKEAERLEKIEISEEMKEELSNIILEIKRNDEVYIKYYNNERYNDVKNKVKSVDTCYKKIIFLDDSYIFFDDILEIKKI